MDTFRYEWIDFDSKMIFFFLSFKKRHCILFFNNNKKEKKKKEETDVQNVFNGLKWEWQVCFGPQDYRNTWLVRTTRAAGYDGYSHRVSILTAGTNPRGPKTSFQSTWTWNNVFYAAKKSKKMIGCNVYGSLLRPPSCKHTLRLFKKKEMWVTVRYCLIVASVF